MCVATMLVLLTDVVPVAALNHVTCTDAASIVVLSILL